MKATLGLNTDDLAFRQTMDSFEKIFILREVNDLYILDAV